MNGLADGSIDTTTVTMAEYMQVAYLSAMNEKHLDVEQTIMYGGNLFVLHACVNQITPPATITSLREKQ